MHCVLDPTGKQTTAQCKKGQTPDFPAGHYPNHTTGCITQQDSNGKLWKYLVGPAQQASWYGRFSPNGTKVPPYSQYVDCAPPKHCLYELTSDESEHVNVAEQNPAVLAKLQARFKAIEQEYHPPKNNPPNDKEGYCLALARTRGYVAPDWRSHDEL